MLAALLLILASSSANEASGARPEVGSNRAVPTAERAWRLEKLPIRLSAVSRARALGVARGEVVVLDPSAHAIRSVNVGDDSRTRSWSVTRDLEDELVGAPWPDVFESSPTALVIGGAKSIPRARVVLLDDRSDRAEWRDAPARPSALAGGAMCTLDTRGSNARYWHDARTVYRTSRALPWTEPEIVYVTSSGTIRDLDQDEHGPLVTLEVRHLPAVAPSELLLVSHRGSERFGWTRVVPVEEGAPEGCLALRSATVVYGKAFVRTLALGASTWTDVTDVPTNIRSAWRLSDDSAVFVSRGDDGESLWSLRAD